MFNYTAHLALQQAKATIADGFVYVANRRQNSRGHPQAHKWPFLSWPSGHINLDQNYPLQALDNLVYVIFKYKYQHLVHNKNILP